MKQYVVFFGWLVTAVACGSAESSSSPSAPPAGEQPGVVQEATGSTFLTCTINGVAFATKHPVEASVTEGILTVGGENDTYALGIDMNAPKVVAGATLTAPANVAQKMTGQANIGFQTETATVTITKKTATAVEGTFSFTATGMNENDKGKTVKVANGKFAATLVSY